MWKAAEGALLDDSKAAREEKSRKGGGKAKHQDTFWDQKKSKRAQGDRTLRLYMVSEKGNRVVRGQGVETIYQPRSSFTVEKNQHNNRRRRPRS